MHSVMGVVAALVVSAAGGESEATESDTVPEMEGRRTFVGLAVPLSSGGLAMHRWGTHTRDGALLRGGAANPEHALPLVERGPPRPARRGLGFLSGHILSGMDPFQTLSFDTPGAWALAGEGRFVPVEPGVLESEGGSGLLWYTPSEFSDFRLQVDWLAHSPEDNSGVFFRFPTAELARQQPDWKAGFEVQIDDRGVDPERDTMGSPLHLTGALYTLAPALVLASKPLGEWNTFDLLAQGPELRVVLNGVEVCVFTAPPHKPRSGRIGLQAHHAGSRVRFRAPRLQRL